jgi:hypothetical protein
MIPLRKSECILHKSLLTSVILRVVLNYETKSKRNERNETKYYETQRNILK